MMHIMVGVVSMASTWFIHWLVWPVRGLYWD